MNKEYEVPVWFRITADHTDQAWTKIANALRELEQYDQLPSYIVEEPVPLPPVRGDDYEPGEDEVELGC